MRNLAIAIVAVLAIGACSAQADTRSAPLDASTVLSATTTPPTDTTASAATTTEPSAAADGPSAVYRTMVAGNHPNGTQARVQEASINGDDLVLLVGISNGHDSDVDLAVGDTMLVTSDGTEYPAAEPDDTGWEVPPGDDRVLAVVFPGAGATADPTLHLNEGGGASDDNRFTDSPTFVLGPLDFATGSAVPDLPGSFPQAESLAHPNGTQLQLQSLGFSSTRIGVAFTATNGHDSEVDLNHGDSYVEDDLGNRYVLIPPLEGERLEVDEGGRLAGVLVFAGRIQPDASSLTVVMNEGGGASDDNRFTDAPTFRAGPFPLDASRVVALPADADTDQTVNHPNGSQVRLVGFEFADNGISASVEVINNHDSAIGLDKVGDTYVEDDLGNRYPVLPPDDNLELTIAQGEGLQGSLVFSGRINPAATTLRLMVQEGGGASDDNRFTDSPTFVFEPVPLTRVAGAPADRTAPLVFGLRTEVTVGSLERSEVEKVQLILSEFDAVETPEGVLLVLPQDVLFDFDRDDLRPDAAVVLAKVAEVLEFYGDAPALIVGHTDAIGSDAYNQDLSERRAQTVFDRLIAEHGIDASRLDWEGRGESEPVADNENPDGSDNPAGRQLNRRVEVLILTDQGIPGG